MNEKNAKDREEKRMEQRVSPAEFLKQDAECLTVFLKQEGQDTEPWVKRIKEWELVFRGMSGNGQRQGMPESTTGERSREELEELLLEQGLDLTSDQLMALGSCYEQQGVLPVQDREYLMVVNTTAFDREDIMESEGHLRIFVDGKPLQVQWTEETTLWKPECVPQHGFRVFETVQADEEESVGTIALDSETLTLETPYFQVQFNEAMELVSLMEKESGQELLLEGTAGNVLYAGGERITDLVCVELAEQGAVRTVLQVVKLFRSSYVVQELVFYEHSKRVDIRISCLWQEQELPLEVQFSFAKEGKKAAVVMEDGRCFMGEEAEQRFMIGSGNTEEAFFLIPYEGESGKSAIVKEVCLISNSAYQLAGQLPFRQNGHCYFHVSSENVLLERVNLADNGEDIILRLQEIAGQETAFTVTMAGFHGSVYETNAQEQTETVLKCEAGKLELTMKPYENRNLCLRQEKTRE